MYLLRSFMAALVILALAWIALAQGSDPLGGQWVGVWSNSLGESGNESLVLSEDANGNLKGVWGDEMPVVGRRVGSKSFALTGETATRFYNITGVVKGDQINLVFGIKQRDKDFKYTGNAQLTRSK
jgi:hypothetical protein